MLIPNVELSWVVAHDWEKLYVNFLYVIADEDGEVHLPKDSSRREIEFTVAEMSEIRRALLADILQMSTVEKPLSPGFFKQLGMLDKASEIEQMLLAPPPPRPRRVKAAASSSARTPQQNLYEISEIVCQVQTAGRAKTWVLVRWAGYDPSWEAWRIRGEEGSPLETWEPVATVRHTEAWQTWLAQEE